MVHCNKQNNVQLPPQVGSRIEHMGSQSRLKYIILDHSLDINSSLLSDHSQD